MRMLIIFIH